MTEKQRKAIEAALAKPARFLEIEVTTKARTKRFTAYDNMLAKMTPAQQAELHARERAAWAEKERLATARPQECPALLAEQLRLIREWERN